MKHDDPEQTKPQKKSAALESRAVSKIKSPPVPTVRKREYRDFDDHVRDGEYLLRLFSEWDDALEAIEEHRGDPHGALKRAKLFLFYLERSSIREHALRFEAGYKIFEAEELYETARQAPDLLNCHTTQVLTRRVVSEQVSMLIGAFPAGTPTAPKVYTRLLVEEIVAARPCARALEATCREIRRTMKFLPTIAELIQVLRKQMEHWSEMLEFGEETIGFYQQRVVKVVAELQKAVGGKGDGDA